MISAYLYSTEHSFQATIISFLRSIIVNAAVILLLPRILGGNAVWFTFAVYEAIVLIIAVVLLKHSEKNGIIFKWLLRVWELRRTNNADKLWFNALVVFTLLHHTTQYSHAQSVIFIAKVALFLLSIFSERGNVHWLYELFPAGNEWFLSEKERNYQMKKFTIGVTMCCKRQINVMAHNDEDALTKAKIVVFDTNAMRFSSDDGRTDIICRKRATWSSLIGRATVAAITSASWKNARTACSTPSRAIPAMPANVSTTPSEAGRYTATAVRCIENMKKRGLQDTL